MSFSFLRLFLSLQRASIPESSLPDVTPTHESWIVSPRLGLITPFLFRMLRVRENGKLGFVT